MHCYIRYIAFATLGILSTSAFSQTPLSQIFKQLHDPDSVIRQQANSQIVAVAVQELPQIELDSALLCASLADPDPMIRQQASGILASLTNFIHGHDSVVQTCNPQLIAASSDTADRVRRNALSTLINEPGGPPQEAQPAFAKALMRSRLDEQQMGAIGLLKMPSGVNQDGKLVAQALFAATNEDTKEGLLTAVSQSGITNEDVSGAAAKLLYDHSSRVQIAAVHAVEMVSSNKATAATLLQNVSSSSSVSPEAKALATSTAVKLRAQ